VEVAVNIPIALAAAILLRLLGVDTLEAMLGKELGNSLLREDGALGKTSMVFVVELMRTSHYKRTNNMLA
jgi:hypothetical protein